MPFEPEEDGGFFYVIEEKIRILFADDDPILREFARVHLTSDQVSVVTAEDGVAAMAALEAEKPDLILLDLEMPNMDGFEFLTELSANSAYRGIPVVVVTGREDVKAIDRAYKAGATSFVVKPLNWRQISYQIRYVHRTHVNELALEARARAAQAKLLNAARTTLAFLGEALARHPDLRPAAAAFVEDLSKLSGEGSAGADPPALRIVA